MDNRVKFYSWLIGLLDSAHLTFEEIADDRIDGCPAGSQSHGMSCQENIRKLPTNPVPRVPCPVPLPYGWYQLRQR